MQIQLHKSDGSILDLDNLMSKISQKLLDEEEGGLCAQESIRLVNTYKNITVLQALMVINHQDVLRILTMFFRAGFLLGRAIHKNALTIHVIRDNDAHNNKDSTANATNNSANSS